MIVHTGLGKDEVEGSVKVAGIGEVVGIGIGTLGTDVDIDGDVGVYIYWEIMLGWGYGIGRDSFDSEVWARYWWSIEKFG